MNYDALVGVVMWFVPAVIFTVWVIARDVIKGKRKDQP